MELNKIYCGNCLDILKQFDDNVFDSICCDHPYELGFMGKSWDNTGIANNVDLWRECLRVLKPGGHLLSFSGTRTYHRMASAIEDAGFEVRDMIEWCYGSGFPKSLNIGKSIESKIKTGSCAKNNFHKLSGDRRDGRIGMYETVEEQGFRKINPNQLGAFDLKPETEEAKKWEGWGTALKPAHEPICMARKPLAEKTVAENCLKWGTGGINIEISRVTSEILDNNILLKGKNLFSYVNNVEKKKFQEDMINLIKRTYFVVESVDMNILEKAIGKIVEDTIKNDILCSEEMLIENININLNTFISEKSLIERCGNDLKYIISTVLKMITDWRIYNVSVLEIIEALLIKAKELKNIPEKQGRFPSNLIHDNSEEVRECFPETNASKAIKGGANRKSYQQNEIINPGGWKEVNRVRKDEGYNDNGGNASRFFKSILYYPKASKSERNKGCKEIGGNKHCTVKSLPLMEYLIKMVTKEGGIVLDPFAGSGTTLVAAKKNGYQYIGCELTEEYIPIIEARLNATDEIIEQELPKEVSLF